MTLILTIFRLSVTESVQKRSLAKSVFLPIAILTWAQLRYTHHVTLFLLNRVSASGLL